MLYQDRRSAQLDGEFAIFLIGMRINRFWKIHQWLPVARAMSRMIQELRAQPDSGLLGYEMWFGRTTLMLQYWRSSEQLLAYAKNRDAAHLPAWKAFNQAVGSNGDVGIWHETYLAKPGSYENIYVNMPAFGLGKAGTHFPATGARASAEGRLQTGVTTTKA